MENNNVNNELNNDNIVRPVIDENNCVVTCDGINVFDCVLDNDTNNINGFIINPDNGNKNKALYIYNDNKWYFGQEISARLNLINLRERTKDERLKIIEKANESKRQNIENKKNFNELAKAMLEQTLNEKQIAEILGTSTSMLLDNSVASVMIARMIQGAMDGSFKCAEFVRDTAGYRPKDVHEVQADVMTDADRRLIENVSKRIG